MRGVARRLDDEAAQGRAPQAGAGRDPGLQQRDDARLEIGENIHEFRLKS